MHESAALLALVETTPGPWPAIADAVEAAGGATQLAAARPETVEAAERWAAVLDRLAVEDPELEVVTVLDQTYPANLAQVSNHPPFLFVRGRLAPSDDLSVALVGSRQPSEQGSRTIRNLAAVLAEAGVTVVSGLARGLDTEAHAAALAAGGRTVAALGSGIRRVYPPENSELVLRIARSGAVVSQFWPEASPSRTTFPERNVVTSGIALATVVVEAQATSGARMQARIAREQGRPVFLVESLVRSEAWASTLVERGEATIVSGTANLLSVLDAAFEERRSASGGCRSSTQLRLL